MINQPTHQILTPRTSPFSLLLFSTSCSIPLHQLNAPPVETFEFTKTLVIFCQGIHMIIILDTSIIILITLINFSKGDRWNSFHVRLHSFSNSSSNHTIPITITLFRSKVKQPSLVIIGKEPILCCQVKSVQ